MTYKVCSHLQRGLANKGTRSVLQLSKEGERVLCCCDCYDDRHGAVVFTVEQKYLDALVVEMQLMQKTKKVN